MKSIKDMTAEELYSKICRMLEDRPEMERLNILCSAYRRVALHSLNEAGIKETGEQFEIALENVVERFFGGSK